MSGNNSIPEDNDWVRLNVGGKVFETTKETLSKYPDSFLARLVNSGLPSTQDKSGAYRIDRSCEHFDIILSYFRNGILNFERNEKDLKDLLCEADFYNIQPLVDEINKAVKLCSKRNEMVIVRKLREHIPMKQYEYGCRVLCHGAIVVSEVQEDYEVLLALQKKIMLYTKSDMQFDSLYRQFGLNDKERKCYLPSVSAEVLTQIKLVLRDFGFVEEQSDEDYDTYSYTWKFVRNLSK